MSESQRIVTESVIVEQCSPKNKKKAEDIFSEYSLKKSNFDPKNTSPNEFIKKLELRMKSYYNDYINPRSASSE
mgnify:CR=1 FL=1